MGGIGAWDNGLRPKQKKFCEMFARNGGNAVQAARAAGYKSPHPEGPRLLRNATIIAALEKLRMSEEKDEIATREERQSFWTEIMRNPDESLANRLKASELLGKSQADFVYRHESTDTLRIQQMIDAELEAELARLLEKFGLDYRPVLKEVQPDKLGTMGPRWPSLFTAP